METSTRRLVLVLVQSGLLPGRTDHLALSVCVWRLVHVHMYFFIFFFFLSVRGYQVLLIRPDTPSGRLELQLIPT